MAMKINELMFGDWVMVEESGLPRKIEGTNDLLFHDDYIPIILTEEILMNNGFERLHHKGTGATEEYSEWFLGGNKITEWLEDWKDHHFSTGGDDCPISFNYVHQLQHLLRLCGIEKEIEL